MNLGPTELKSDAVTTMPHRHWHSLISHFGRVLVSFVLGHLASKWPLRSRLTSDLNSVTSKTYIPMVPLLLNASMSLIKRGD